MKLTFKADEVIVSLRSGRNPLSEVSGFSTRLLGRARVQKEDDSTEPVFSEEEIPDYVGESKLEDIWLPAFVHFLPPAYFEGKQIYQPDWLDHEDVPPRPWAGTAVAEIYYSEAGSEMSRYHGGDAQVSISLRLETDSADHSQALHALQDDSLRLSIELDDIYFTRNESIREKFGIPTWDSFLRSECRALSGRYTLSFSRKVVIGEQGYAKSDQ